MSGAPLPIPLSVYRDFFALFMPEAPWWERERRMCIWRELDQMVLAHAGRMSKLKRAAGKPSRSK